jgi:hypothetical protein
MNDYQSFFSRKCWQGIRFRRKFTLDPFSLFLLFRSAFSDFKSQTLLFPFACYLLSSCVSIAPKSDCLTVDQVRSLGRNENVSVCGQLTYGFENKNLYASREDAEKFKFKHCIAVGLADKFDSSQLVEMSGKWVRVTGLLTQQSCPKDSICPAACSNVGIFVKTVEVVPPSK